MMIFAHIRDSFADAFFPRLSEWGAALTLFLLGWILTVNDELMTAAGSGRGYTLMLSIASQSTWARLLMLFSAARLIILVVNGAWRRSPWFRSITAVASCFFWTQIMLSFAPTMGFAFGMACGLLGMEIVNIFRAARDARIVDDACARGRHGTVS